MPSHVLMVRLYSYGVRGNVLQWIRKFFHGRSHQTRVGEALSTESSLLSKVVQGSGIGPVLFLTYIDDLTQLLERNGIQAKFFADDVKVYLEIYTVYDTIKVQTALDLISIWDSEWQLQLSTSKCDILDIGHVPHDTTHTYTTDASVLLCSVKCRDLGIIITRDLSPSQHIHAITAKAHQRANSIHRCCLSGDHNSLVRAFVVYVRHCVPSLNTIQSCGHLV